jgi:Rod binding domain-containing protein
MRFPSAEQLKPLDLVGPHRTPPRKLEANDLDPTSRLAKPGAGAEHTQHAKLLKQSQTWVAQTFFGTLLKQMEDSPFKSEIFSGGRGGEAFSSLYHQRLAEHMSRGAGSKLVNAIVRKIEAKQGSKAGQGSPVQAAEKKQDAGLNLRHRNPRSTYKRGGISSTLDLLS